MPPKNTEKSKKKASRRTRKKIRQSIEMGFLLFANTVKSFNQSISKQLDHDMDANRLPWIYGKFPTVLKNAKTDIKSAQLALLMADYFKKSFVLNARMLTMRKIICESLLPNPNVKNVKFLGGGGKLSLQIILVLLLSNLAYIISENPLDLAVQELTKVKTGYKQVSAVAKMFGYKDDDDVNSELFRQANQFTMEASNTLIKTCEKLSKAERMVKVATREKEEKILEEARTLVANSEKKNLRNPGKAVDSAKALLLAAETNNVATTDIGLEAEDLIASVNKKYSSGTDLMSECISGLSAEHIVMVKKMVEGDKIPQYLPDATLPKQKGIAVVYTRVKKLAESMRSSNNEMSEIAEEFMEIVHQKLSFQPMMIQTMEDTIGANINTFANAYYSWATNLLKLSKEMKMTPEEKAARQALTDITRLQKKRELERFMKTVSAKEDIEDIRVESDNFAKLMLAQQGATEKETDAKMKLDAARTAASAAWWASTYEWANVTATGATKVGLEYVAAPVRTVVDTGVQVISQSWNTIWAGIRSMLFGIFGSWSVIIILGSLLSVIFLLWAYINVRGFFNFILYIPRKIGGIIVNGIWYFWAGGTNFVRWTITRKRDQYGEYADIDHAIIQNAPVMQRSPRLIEMLENSPEQKIPVLAIEDSIQLRQRKLTSSSNMKKRIVINYLNANEGTTYTMENPPDQRVINATYLILSNEQKEQYK